ncbi:MAG: TraB/GumN family protein [Leptolyngbyaceae cyanobacterium]
MALGYGVVVGSTIVPAAGLAAAPANLAESPENSFLWQIETPTNTVYLLGSIHFLAPENYPLPTAMQTAFAEAEYLVLEADVGPGTEFATAMLLFDKAVPEPGEMLTEVLGPESYELAAQRAEALGMGMGFFDQYEPWFLSVTLTSLQLLSLGFSPEYGVDLHFYGQAQASETPILFLETVEQQFDLFEQLSIDEQRSFTEQTLAELDLFEASFDEVLAAWKAGDGDRMAEILLTGFENYPGMQDIFLGDRNRDWVTQILPWLQTDDDYLIVGGALHLVGPDNVLELLEAEGYNAKQL